MNRRVAIYLRVSTSKQDTDNLPARAVRRGAPLLPSMRISLTDSITWRDATGEGASERDSLQPHDSALNMDPFMQPCE